MDKEYITRLIYEYNSHLRGGTIEVPRYRRDLYTAIDLWREKKQAIAIVGLRRTGKTTLMRQMMQEMGNDAAFFSFDEEETQKKDVLVFVLDYFLNNFHSRTIFLDEIHYIRDWEGILKRYYDQKGTKFIVSGSESLELSKAKATLAGRLVTFQLEPLRFSEYLQLKGHPPGVPVPARDDWAALQDFWHRTLAEKEYFEREFLQYLFRGAFPELCDEDDSTVIRKYIYELVVKKIIYQDIPAIYEIRRRDLLFDLFRYCCNNSANLFEVKNLCSTLNANYETVTNYLFYLRSAFLITVAESYTGSAASRLRRNKKVYVVHPAIAFAVMGFNFTMLVEKVLGPYVETVFAGKYFWRDKQKNEVDVVLDTEPLLPIEVKFQEHIAPSDLKGLRTFMAAHGVSRGILVTKNTFRKITKDEKEIFMIPAWMYLLVKQAP
jgi:predicted AAA+ superfamily ATPase